jgi:hypothetical protein
MTDRKPAKTAPGRSERLRAALRENLKRRKVQARGRAAAAQPSDDARGPARKETDEGST